LFWNQHFTQKLANNPLLVKESANAVFQSNYAQMYAHDARLIVAWQEGKTGYPLVDASMRALNQTGFLNFRMRAMVASFFAFILRQPWQIGADYMFSQLIDADTAINYSQWQMQTGQVGIHPNRIYNPTKQILEFDPQVLFIRKYVPELRNTELSVIVQDPESDQLSLFDSQYLKPVVSYKTNLQKSRQIYKDLNQKAFALIKSDTRLQTKLALEEVSKARLQRNQIPDTKEV
jgi:deoxyribodipyrimidine photo-lyase